MLDKKRKKTEEVCSVYCITEKIQMNIFMREMNAHRKSLILWSIGMFFMIIGGMAKYATFSNSGQSINDLMSTIPDSIKAILGFGHFDLSKASGFYGMLYVYLVVMATIHASMLGANIISKEERDRTTEFLMVKPISRSRIVTSKLLAALVNVLILNLVTLLFSISILGKYSNGEAITGEILTLMLGMFLLQLIFLFIGTGIASASKNPAVPASIATSILLVCYILSVIVDINDNLAFLKYITPFKYFDAQSMISGGGLDPLFIGLSVIIITGLVWGTYALYRKRDLKV